MVLPCSEPAWLDKEFLMMDCGSWLQIPFTGDFKVHFKMQDYRRAYLTYEFVSKLVFFRN